MSALWSDALRALRHRPGASAITVLGLLLAQAACLLVALLALALATPAPHLPAPDRVAVLDFRQFTPGRPVPWPTGSPVAFGPLLQARGLPADRVARVAYDGLDIQHQGRQLPAFLLMADPSAVALLGLPSLQGDLAATLRSRDGIAISQSLLRRLWGELPAAQALGRSVQARGQVFTVGAVVPDQDPRSPFVEPSPLLNHAMAVVGFDSAANAWPEARRQSLQETNGRVFVGLGADTPPAQLAHQVREALQTAPGYTSLPANWRDGRQTLGFRAVPLSELPFEGEANFERWSGLQGLGAASVLLLVLASFNAMNLQAAQLLRRQQETAVRRALGAGTAQLLRLWAAEALLPLLLAAGGAALMAWWTAPAVGRWMEMGPGYGLGGPLPAPAVWGLLACTAVLLPLTLAGPAWAALRREPARALQGRTASEGPAGRRLRQTLLTLQVSGALVLLVLAGVGHSQHRHLMAADQGFDTHNRLWLGVLANPEDLPDLRPFLNAVAQHPAITHWATSDHRPAADTRGQEQAYRGPAAQPQTLRVSTVSPGFFATYGMRLLAGQPRALQGEVAVVLDAKAVQALGFGSAQAALGALVQALPSTEQAAAEGNDRPPTAEAPRRVVAVVAAVRLESAYVPALPQAFVLSEAPQWDISFHGPDATALRTAVDDLWAQHGPPVPHVLRTADEQRAGVYVGEARITTAITVTGALALVVAMLGAYALVADTLRRRRTALVLHRLHGASAAAVAGQVLREVLPPLGAALVLGGALAAWLGNAYLGDFVEAAPLTSGLLWPLLVAATACSAALLLACAHQLRLALALQPVEALR